MGVILARTAGYCWGVKRAIDIAMDIAKGREGETILTHGPLIHNSQAVDLLRQKRVRPLESGEAPQRGTVVVRAHGVSPQTRSEIKSWGVKLKDATCPIVARVQGVIKKYARRGYCTVIIGEEGHPEIIGLMGFTEGRGHVVRTVEEAEALPALDPVNVVAQTTANTLEYAKIVSVLKRKFPGCEVTNTICHDTIDRQDEIVSLAESVDAMVVVGGHNSGNTQRLAEISRSFGRPTYHVETEDELDLRALGQYEDVGVIAGASTPSWMIQRVMDAIKDAKGEWSALGTGWQRVAGLFLKTNVYAAAGAALMALLAGLLQGTAVVPWYLLVPSLYIFAMHTFNYCRNVESSRYNDPSRARLYERSGRWMYGAAAAALLAALGVVGLHSLPAFFILLFAGIAGSIYCLHLEPTRFKRLNLWLIPASKCIMTPAAWALVTVVLPLFLSPAGLGRTISWGTLSVLLYVAMLVFSVSAMLDLRDIQGDRIVGKETLPILISTWMTRRAIQAVTGGTAVLLALSAWLGLITPLGYALLLSPAYTAWVLHYSHQRKVMNLLVSQCLIEGCILLPGIVALGWYWLT
ncbi:MAG: 4-hydroxy-3-methylbut-2-enyl diphosphate reductase [Nitrospinota bacterium]